MRHYVLFKFEEGYMNQNLLRNAEDTFQTLESQLPEEIQKVNIFTNCVDRDTNYDLMIAMDLRNTDSLEKYLTHPIHKGLVKEWLPHIERRASFDC